MALERSWYGVSALFTADGTTQGIITVADVAGFYVGQTVLLTSNAQPNLTLKIRRINGTTQLIVGLAVGTGTPTDVSAYHVADGAKIAASEQLKPRIKKEDQDQASYESEPIDARRVIPVDEYGQFISESNPLPVTPGGGLSPSKIGQVVTAYDTNSNPILYSFYSKTVLQGSISVTYDSNGNAVDYQGYDANGNPL